MPNESAHNAFSCEAYERFFVPTLLLEATLRSVSVKEGWQSASKDSMTEKIKYLKWAGIFCLLRELSCWQRFAKDN
jgi:hypothetical protein